MNEPRASKTAHSTKNVEGDIDDDDDNNNNYGDDISNVETHVQ